MSRNLFLDILYPRHCPVCHEITVPRGKKICDTCKEKLRPIQGPRCFCCSKPLERAEQEYCKDCGKIRQFQQGLGIFLQYPSSKFFISIKVRKTSGVWYLLWRTRRILFQRQNKKLGNRHGYSYTIASSKIGKTRL